MDANHEASRFIELYARLYHLLYRRRDPREARPSGEALAMLQHLRDSGPLTVSEAARHFDRSQSSISERIERLLEQGLVERLADERDQRRHLIWLTPKAEALLEVELQVLDAERLARVLERLSTEDRTDLLRGFAALLRVARDDED